jgi:hypothetical protein
VLTKIGVAVATVVTLPFRALARLFGGRRPLTAGPAARATPAWPHQVLCRGELR